MLVAHGGAVIALFVAAISLPFKIAVLAGLCASLVWQLRRLGGRLNIAIEDNGECRISDSRGEYRGRVADDSFVSSGLVILNIHAEARKSIVITPERIDADTFRRLRVFLRWGMHDDNTRDAVNINSSLTEEQI